MAYYQLHTYMSFNKTFPCFKNVKSHQNYEMTQTKVFRLQLYPIFCIQVIQQCQ